MIELICGDCIEEMKTIKDNTIDLTVTSPPYDNLRSYKGNNKYWNDNVWKNVIKELYRTTKEGGVIVWVVGDAIIKGCKTLTSFKQAIYFKEVGFNVYDVMIYKKNVMKPNSNHYYNVFEYMFILSKGIPKKINLLKDRKNKCAGHKKKQIIERQKNGILLKNKKEITIREFGRRTNIWEYSVGKGNSTKDNIAFKHPAIFPEKLVKDHIISWSNKGDLIFDPFMGSGTTGKMALLLERDFVGIELDKEYYEIAKQRIEKYKNTLKQDSLFEKGN